MKTIAYQPSITTEHVANDTTWQVMDESPSGTPKKGKKIDPAGPIIEHVSRSRLPARLHDFLVGDLDQILTWGDRRDRTIDGILCWWVWHWKSLKAWEAAEANGTPLDDYYAGRAPADTVALCRALATLDDALFEALIDRCSTTFKLGHGDAMAAVRGARDLYGSAGASGASSSAP